MGYDYYGNPVNDNTSTFTDCPPKYEKLVAIREMESFGGYITDGEYFYPTSTTYRFVAVPCNGGDKIYAEGNGVSGGRLAILKSFQKPTISTAMDFATGETSYHTMFQASIGLICPNDARWIVVQTKNNGNDVTPIRFTVGDRQYHVDVRDEIYNNIYDRGVKWVAFGDSITAGYYSEFDADGVGQTVGAGQKYVYPQLIADRNHWDLTNMGVGGCGWIYTPTSVNGLVYNKVRAVEWGDYNLVTFASGINDYINANDYMIGSKEDVFTYSETMTPTTMVESMRFSFEYIARHNPKAKVVVLLPLNYVTGEMSDGYARGTVKTKTSKKTLDEISALIKSICDEYGIETIDLTHESCVNILNINQMMADGIHPTKECHELLAREIGAKISMS